jgi:phage terminase large subunit-like protein
LREVEALERKFEPDIIVLEASGLGLPVYQQVRSTIGTRVCRATPEKGKSERAEGVTPMIEAGKVFLPRHADWLQAFRDEVRAFPAGKYDDQVDSMVQFLANRQRLVERAHLDRRPARSINTSTAYLPTVQVDVTLISEDRKEFLARHDPVFQSLLN